jgi:hypothetical protein
MERGRNATFTVLAGVLLLLVVLAAFLLLMLAPRSQGNLAQPQVGQLQPVTCPAGSHAPVCYQATVTNLGSGAGTVTCQVAPASGTTAEFANHQPTYATPAETPLQVDASITLTVLTKPTKGHKSVAGSPMVACTGA